MSRRLNSRERRNQRNHKTHGFRNAVLGCCCVAPAIALVSLYPTKDANASWTAVWTYVKQNLLTSETNDTFKTSVTQDAIGSQMTAETLVIAKQKQATAETQLLKKDNLLNMYDNYLGKSALPDNSRCLAMNERQNDDQITDRAKTFAFLTLNDAIANEYYGDEYQQKQAMTELRSNVACSLELAKQGFCTPTISTGIGYDVDFSLLNTSNRLDESQFLATKIGIDTIANTAQDKIIDEKCESGSACASLRIAEQNRTAVNSIVANSLLSQLYNRMALGGAKDGVQ